MSQTAQPSPKRGLIIAVASAALTLAAGITLGALLGYVRPTPSAPAPAPAPSEERGMRASAAEPPPIVDAPVDEAKTAAVEPEPEPFVRRHHREHEEREHDEREHEEHEHDD